MGRRHLAALTAAAVLAAGGCGDEIEDSFEPLGAAVREAARTDQPVRLASVTDFDWDRVHAFYAYASDDDVADELGFDWGGADESKSSVQDGYSLLVFVEDGEVVPAFDHEYVDGDLSCIGPRIGGGGLTPAEAVLRVTPTSFRGEPPSPAVSLAHPRDARQARRTERCLRTYA